MSKDPVTWHHGLVARVWGESLQDPSREIGFFDHVIARYGQPVLDAGCGAGRLLLPWLRAGIDIEGCDVSADMLAEARRRAAAEGLTAHVHRQAMHEIELPRTYRTIVMCGAIGVGSDRRRDLEGLRRCRRHLAPGGVLVVDNHLPWLDEGDWSRWRGGGEPLPEDWPPRVPPDDRGSFADGTQFEMCARKVAFDPLTQTEHMEIRVRHFVEGVEAADEIHPLQLRLYLPDELLALLETAGFSTIEVFGDYADRPAAAGDKVHVYVAHNGDPSSRKD
jgi:SAM-dependent methyltransferase